MVGKLIQLDGVNNMKRYAIKKECVRIDTTYNPILARYDYIIVHESGEIIETLSEEELKLEEGKEMQPLVILDGTRIAMLQICKLLRRNDLGLLKFKEICEVCGTTFEVYAIYDREREEFIGYLEDFK